MLPGEHQQVLSNLQSHFDEFLQDSEESEVFTVADCAQLERDVATCKEYYQELLRSAERGKDQVPLHFPRWRRGFLISFFPLFSHLRSDWLGLKSKANVLSLVHRYGC